MNSNFDFIIIGAGIIGLSVAREILKRHRSASILILEKENSVGKHASGRNSGVLHSGVYYPEESLKAKLCSSSGREILQYCKEHKLPINQIGKVIVPQDIEGDDNLEMLLKRAGNNGAKAELIDEQQLIQIEPMANSYTGRALFCPETTVVSPMAVLKQLKQELADKGVTFEFSTKCEDINLPESKIITNGTKYSFGTLVNCAGAFADKIAKMVSVGEEYVLLPFKGRYYELSDSKLAQPKRLIYPSPNLNMPFLGIHSVADVNGKCYFGPSATPALGRENYKFFKNVNFDDAFSIGSALLKQYVKNDKGFRRYMNQEVINLTNSGFVASVARIVKGLDYSKLVSSEKVGIRPQLYNKLTNKLEMDFVIEPALNTIHVLNAISPAFTSSFGVAGLIVDKIER